MANLPCSHHPHCRSQFKERVAMWEVKLRMDRLSALRGGGNKQKKPNKKPIREFSKDFVHKDAYLHTHPHTQLSIVPHPRVLLVPLLSLSLFLSLTISRPLQSCHCRPQLCLQLHLSLVSSYLNAVRTKSEMDSRHSKQVCRLAGERRHRQFSWPRHFVGISRLAWL